MKQFSPIIDEYLDFCRVHRGLCARTLDYYGIQLQALEVFLETRDAPSLHEISLDDLDAFLDERGKVLARVSLAGVASVIRGFLRYLFLVGIEPEDRSGWIEGPSLFAQMKLPRHLEDHQVEAAFARLNLSKRSGIRDRAALMLLHHYGWRAGEVVGLQMNEIDFDGSRLQVQRLKGGKRQVFPLVEPVRLTLQAYLKIRPASSHSCVFLNVSFPYRPFTSASLCGRVRKYLEGVSGTRGAHSLRHTLARRLRQGGAPIPVISCMLGHRNPDSTATYIRIATDELAEVADNYANLL